MNSAKSISKETPKAKSESEVDLDELDIRILNLLQDDSRLSFNKIATHLGISVGTAFNHVKSLEKRGVLKGYTVVTDQAKIGYGLTAFILIQVDGGCLLDVENEIAKETNVVAVYDITGDYDAAVITKFKQTAALNTFIKKLMGSPHVKRTVTSVVLNVVKEDLRVKLEESQPTSIGIQ